MKNKPLSIKTRFSIFERDGFSCQYCGQKPPNTVLEIDHIYPKSKGGKNDLDNLTTSCFECNRGKRDRILGSVSKGVAKRINNIKEKEKQMEAFYNYQKKIEKIIDKKVEKLSKLWADLWGNRYTLNLRGYSTIKMFLKYLPESEIEEAMYIATGKISNSVENCYKYLCGILHNKKRTLYGEK